MSAFSSSSIFLVLSALGLSLSLSSCDSGRAPHRASDNSAPVFEGPQVVVGPENRAFSYLLSATDKDGDTLVYNIVGGDDAKSFNMNSLTGEVSAQEPFDYEVPTDADGDGRFELVVSVSDLVNPPAVQSLSIVVGDEQYLAPSLLFPADRSQLGRVETLKVMGRLMDSDSESGEIKPMAGAQGAVTVTVNDVEATFDGNHGGLWSATIPVHQGQNVLDVNVTDALGIKRGTAYEVFSHDHVLANAAFSMSPQSGLFYIADNVNQAIYSFSPVSGEVLRVAESFGSELALPVSMQLDPQGERLVFLDTVASSLVVADLAQGTMNAVVSGEATLNRTVDMTVDWAQNRVFVADAVGVATVDLDTGARQYVYEFATDNAFAGMNSIVLDSSLQRLLFIPSYDGRQLDNGIYALDIDTASVTLVAGDDGGSTSSDTKIAAFDGSERVWLVSYDSLKEVNLRTGERDSLYDGDYQFTMGGFRSSTQVVFEQKSQRLLFTKGGQTGIYAYDLATGDFSKFADPQQPVASGEKIESLSSVAVDTGQERAIGVDGDARSIWSISLKDGARTKLLEVAQGDPGIAPTPISARLDASGENLYFLELLPTANADKPVIYKVDIAQELFDVLYHSAELASDIGVDNHTFVLTPSTAIDNVNQRLLMSVEFDRRISLYWYDLLRGQLTLLREDVYSEGFQSHSLSELDLDNQRVITGDWHNGLIRSVNLQTGEVQTIVADNDGYEPELKSITSVALDAPGNRALVADVSLNALIWVDLSSGEREVVSGLGVGQGPSFGFIDDITLDQENERAFLQAGNSLMMINLINGDRAIVSN